jgi:hypothetical protein
MKKRHGMATLSLERLLIDGTLLGGGLGLLILLSLFVNPRIWLQDYPAEIRDQQPPLSRREKNLRALCGVFIIGGLFGGLLMSTWLLRASSGGVLSFPTAWLHMYGLFTTFNLVDAVVIDYMILGSLKPVRLLVPGSAALLQRHLTLGRYLHDFAKGQLIGVVICLPLAWLIS